MKHLSLIFLIIAAVALYVGALYSQVYWMLVALVCSGAAIFQEQRAAH